MGRLTEILCSVHTRTIPTSEQVFSININDYETREHIKELRKGTKCTPSTAQNATPPKD